MCLSESEHLVSILPSRLNSLDLDNTHSCLFFEDELIASSLGSIKSLKSEVYQVCHNYYSTRLDLLDNDMTSSPSEMPPRTKSMGVFPAERVIRVMLKMSFFNECLSSLNIQDSNALYAYTRCLEYYSRVQDFCLSLFSDVPFVHPSLCR